MLKSLVETIARAIVDSPSDVKVAQVEGERSNIIELHVAKEDLGKVIGKKGNIASAIRTILRAASAKDGKRIQLEIID